MFGLAIVFSISFIEKLFFNAANKSSNSNMLFAYKGLFTTTFLGISAAFAGWNSSFVSDIAFWLLLVLELLVALKSKYVYKMFETRFAYVSFALFASIYLMPIVSHLYKNILGFENNIPFVFEDLGSLAAFSGALFILNSLFFYDKIRRSSTKGLSTKETLILFAFSLLMVHTLYLSTSMIQKYEPFTLYFFVLALGTVAFFAKASTNREKYKIKRADFLVIPSHVITLALSFVGAKLLAVEFFTLFKRLGAVYSGYLFDHFNNRESKRSKLEMGVLATITTLVLSIYFIR